jgi:taurine dioxygenase
MNAPALELHAKQPYRHIRVSPVTVNIGADIEGVDLTRPLAAEVLAEIRRAWLQYKVIFFRDQDLTGEQHVAFAKCFSDLEPHPVSPSVPEHPELMLLARGETRKNSENEFHTDMTFRTVPPMGAVLRAVELPEVGGDTVWVNMAAAYQGLSKEVKEKIDGLVAVHDAVPVFAHRLDAEQLAALRRDYPPVEHPLVVTHPETGEKVLYVNRIFTTHITNAYTGKFIRRPESDALLTLLFNQVTLPEYQVRFRWRRNSIAAWDNRATQHYAVLDYIDDSAPRTRRVMHRATLKGVARPVA